MAAGIIGYVALAVGVFFLDFSLKNHIEKTKAEGEVSSVCDDRLLVRNYHNKGAFLNAGEKRSSMVSLISLLLTLALTVLFLTTFCYRGKKTLKAGLSLMLGGAYSNTYDRLARKYVVDYVSFPVRNQKIRNIVFNISDFCIVIGALLMVLGSTAKR